MTWQNLNKVFQNAPTNGVYSYKRINNDSFEICRIGRGNLNEERKGNCIILGIKRNGRDVYLFVQTRDNFYDFPRFDYFFGNLDNWPRKMLRNFEGPSNFQPLASGAVQYDFKYLMMDVLVQDHPSNLQSMVEITKGIEDLRSIVETLFG